MKELLAAIKKYQHDIYFTGVGLALAAVLIVFFVQALGFVASQISAALETDTTADNTVRFNLDGLHQLNLGAPSVSVPASASTSVPAVSAPSSPSPVPAPRSSGSGSQTP